MGPVALLIPAYNAADHLPALLADAQVQEPPFAEILVYDDASTDHTAEVAARLGATRVLRGTTNHGAAYARNQLLAAAASPWLHFHDADDRLAPGFTAAMAAADPLADEILLTALTVRWLGKDGSEKVTRHSYAPLDGTSDPALVLEHEFQIGCGLYPADLVRKAGGFNAALRGAEDHDFHMRLVLAGGRFRALETSFNTYCVREGQGWSRTHEARMRSDWHQVLLHYAQNLPPHCRPTLGRLIMENAYKLYAAGRKDLAKEAIQSARSLGQTEITSSQAWLRLLSRVTGPAPIFFIRRLLA